MLFNKDDKVEVKQNVDCDYAGKLGVIDYIRAGNICVKFVDGQKRNYVAHELTKIF